MFIPFSMTDSEMSGCVCVRVCEMSSLTGAPAEVDRLCWAVCQGPARKGERGHFDGVPAKTNNRAGNEWDWPSLRADVK